MKQDTIIWTKYPLPEFKSRNKYHDYDDIFESISSTVISSIHKSLGKGSDQIIDPDHVTNISKYKPLAGSSCMKLPKKWDH